MPYPVGENITLDELISLIREKKQISLSKSAVQKITRCREYLDKKIKNNKEPIYGINTGFGALYNTHILPKDLEKLQENLVRSHACGTGEEVPAGIVKNMLLLKILGLAKGFSGVQLATAETLVRFYNEDILPVVYQQGSLGASGDLAPLAHLSLPLIGEGEVYYKGKKVKSDAALSKAGIKPLKFRSKEALALLNGTQFMSAYALWCITEARRLADAADLTGALSLEAFDGRPEPFSELIHEVRPHAGQKDVGIHFRKLLKGSKLIGGTKKHVQDPYSFRCIPQVHGASRDVIRFAEQTLITEINSVTDNPTIFPEEDKIISGGNFHGQPLALMLDMLAIAIAELGSISERRTFLLISGQRELPPFLVSRPGLNSGFMIPQYTAASIVSQNKQLCTPASVDSIVSSNGQEDHVSMGANAATKCHTVIQNTWSILGIELFTAAQGLDFRKPGDSSPQLKKLHDSFRKQVAFLDTDDYLHPYIKRSTDFIRTYSGK